MSGFTDAFYEAATARLKAKEIEGTETEGMERKGAKSSM
jgi:hypothetical protein